MTEIESFIRTHNLSGGMALIAKDMLQQGMNEVHVEYALLEYGCDEIVQYFRLNVLKDIAFLRFLASEMTTRLPAGNSDPTVLLLEQKARFIEHGLNRVLPPTEHH